MVPSLLFDISGIDLDRVKHGPDVIERVNPHRGAMRMIDAIVYETPDLSEAIAYKDVRCDEFWVPGHIPGRPIFPGVLMIEAAAQLASFTCLRRLPGQSFMGFAGVDGVKFRGQVLPGDRMYLLLKEFEFRRRRCICDMQGLVRGQIVVEGRIIGMPMEVREPSEPAAP
ncbi:MAG TPA: 3-hydroxyacyl-ACP dehydratase FabZ family protein [Phycisphaeraceae bacterium]